MFHRIAENHGGEGRKSLLQEKVIFKLYILQPEYSKYIRPDIGVRDIEIINKPLDKGLITTECIKKLEGQINHFRSASYTLSHLNEIK